MLNVSVSHLGTDLQSFYSSNKVVHVEIEYGFCLLQGIPYITDCVMAEIEKLGMKYRVALR